MPNGLVEIDDTNVPVLFQNVSFCEIPMNETTFVYLSQLVKNSEAFREGRFISNNLEVSGRSVRTVDQLKDGQKDVSDTPHNTLT